MKNELKISTVSIICVLCASGLSGAYGASSVRTLGGAGTYTSAASASQSGGGAGVARAGSVRVSPATAKATTTTPSNTAATTAGRAASPRLSLGKYLGGGTAISGGSSARPGNGTSGGGTTVTDPSLAAELNNRVNVLEDKVDDLKSAGEDLKETKQDKLVGGNYITIENGEVFLDVDSFGSDTSASVKDGKLMLSIAGGTPIELIQVSELLSEDDMNGAIESALESKGFLTQDDIKDLADGVAANKTAIENLKLVSGDITDLADTVSGKADKQPTATSDSIAVIGADGQYVGSDKKLSDFYTAAQIDDKIKPVTNFEERMETLTTEVTENMEALTQEMTTVNNTIKNITNEDGQVVNIAPNTITNVEIAPNTITNVEIAPNTITSVELANGAVEEANLTTAVKKQLVGKAEGNDPNGMYVLLVTPQGERIWADLAMGANESGSSSYGPEEGPSEE